MKTCPHCGGSLEESPQTSLVLSPPEGPEQPAFLLPLVGGATYAVQNAMLEIWRMAYPGVDVSSEIAKMRAWLASNPKKGKTRRGIVRFANSWLSKAQDESSRNGNGRRAYGFEAEREQIARVMRSGN